jgi:hypothetical protein
MLTNADLTVPVFAGILACNIFSIAKSRLNAKNTVFAGWANATVWVGAKKKGPGWKPWSVFNPYPMKTVTKLKQYFFIHKFFLQYLVT